MAAAANSPEIVYQTALVNYLISMAKTVESAIGRANQALLERDARQASAIFLLEPRINEMELRIDEHAIRLLRGAVLSEETVRFVVATLKINNDLERMGDLAVNIAERVISLAEMEPAGPPPELVPMAGAVQAMVSKSLGALVYQNAELAGEILESEAAVDNFRDAIFERLLALIGNDLSQAPPSIHFLLASRHLERIADHCTNIAEDILYWLRGLDVRHGRALGQNPAEGKAEAPK
jgi:phosphate transport system protein